MATATVDELTYVSFPIEKWEKTDDGDLIVYGKATDGSVDSDDQIVSPSWSAKALADWHGTDGGNVRVQHQALRDPAGKSLSVEIDKDGDSGHWVKSLIVEPVAKRLVEKGILRAYSVGIARPVIKRDPSGKARGGIVDGGSLAEISLVDRPANKACGFILGKADKSGEIEVTGELVGDEEMLAKFAADEGLLFKGDTGSGDDSDDAAVARTDDGENGDDGDGGSDAAMTDDTDDEDAVSKADGETRLAYKAARAEYLTREPGVKGAANGTEYLAKRAEWVRWHAEGEAEGLSGTREAAERWLAKRDFSARERHAAASSGAAMPDGSFPIKNGEDLGNAIHLAGHAKDPGAARAHIKRRAAALGMSGRIPDSWKGEVDEADLTTLVELIGKGLIAVEDARMCLGEDAWKAANGDGTVGSNSSSFASGGKKCPTCKGDGKIKGGNVKCPDCGGSGKAPASKADSAESETDLSATAKNVPSKVGDGLSAKAGGVSPEVGDGASAEVGDGLSAKAGAGKTMSEAAPSAGEVEAADLPKGTKDCSSCGASYDADSSAKFCGSCGKKLPGAKKARKARERAEREAAIEGLAGTVLKSVEAGILTQEAADEIIAEAAAAAEVQKASRPLPPDTHQAGQHREPDGTSTVERLEPQAGLATDPDRTPDKVPPSVSSLGTGMKAEAAGDLPYAIGRMHDLTCAAYNPAETLASFPALKSVADAVDPGPFLDSAVAAMTDGDTRKAAEFGHLVEAARLVKGTDPEALADASAALHKAFSDMYPTEHITPQSGIKPGTYQRPYLAAGHAAENASSNGGSNIPSSAHTPEPEDFQRPLITAGHEADSPANRKADTGPPGEGAMATTSDFRTTTGAARTYYSNAQRDAAKAALRALHDHIAGSFPDLCPMASSKSVMPPDMGANDTPRPAAVTGQGGIPSVKSVDVPLTAPQVVDGPAVQQAIADAIRRHTARGVGVASPVQDGRPLITRKQLQKAARRYGLDLVDRRETSADPAVHNPTPGISLEEMKALLSDQISPLIERHETQMDDLRKQVDDLGARPDPAMAPVRGQLAKAPADELTPVERRSLVDEAAENTNKSFAAHESSYREYVAALTRSPDPGVREAALATFDKLSAATG